VPSATPLRCLLPRFLLPHLSLPFACHHLSLTASLRVTAKWHSAASRAARVAIDDMQGGAAATHRYRGMAPQQDVIFAPAPLHHYAAFAVAEDASSRE
jgi:hypothetical protein